MYFPGQLLENPVKLHTTVVKQIQLSTECKSQKSDYKTPDKTPVKTFLSIASQIYSQQKSMKKGSLSKYVNAPKILSDTKEIKQLDLNKMTSEVSSPSANIAEEMPKKVSKTSNKQGRTPCLMTSVSVFKMPSSTTHREKVNMFKNGSRKSVEDVSSTLKKIKISKTNLSQIGLQTNFDLSSVYQANLREKRGAQQDSSQPRSLHSIKNAPEVIKRKSKNLPQDSLRRATKGSIGNLSYHRSTSNIGYKLSDRNTNIDSQGSAPKSLEDFDGTLYGAQAMINPPAIIQKSSGAAKDAMLKML
jgi:uncharacterized ubiquitin-like protein YukD